MSFLDFGVAPLAVNNYLWETMKTIEPSLSQTKNYGQKTPFFPLGDSASGNKSWENKTYVVYDRMFKTMKDPFYPIKCEEIRYNLRAKEEDSFTWGSVFQTILDRQDDSGKDINAWIRENGGTDIYPIYFHSTRIYQVASSLSSEKQGVRPYYVTEFIVYIKYHYTKSLEDYL